MTMNNLLLSMVIYFRDMGNEFLITFLFSGCILFNLVVTFLIYSKQRTATPLAANARMTVVTDVNETRLDRQIADRSKMQVETANSMVGR